MNALNVRKLLAIFPSHPESSLDRHWQVTQLCLLILPVSPLFGGVTLFVNSAFLWRRYANHFVQSFLNQVLLLLGAWMVIIALFADRKDFSLLGLLNFLPFFVVFVAQSFLFRETRQLRQMALLLVLPSVPIALLAIGQIAFGWTFNWKILSIGGGDGVLLDWVLHPGGVPFGRASSLFYYATILASYLVMTLTVSFGLWADAIIAPPVLRQKGWKGWGERLYQSRWGLAIVVGINAVALFLTQSRNAWGIAVAVGTTFAFILGYRWIVACIMGSGVTVLAAAYAPPPLNLWFRSVVPQMIWARINDDLFQDRPVAALRVNQWKFAWSLVEQRPFTGWGLRNFSSLYESATKFYIGHPHNLALMLSSEMGIPATLVFYALVGGIVFRGVRRVRQMSGVEERSLFTIVVAFLGCAAFSLFDVPIFDSRINALGWMLLAGIWGVVQQPIAQKKRGDPAIAPLSHNPDQS